MRQNTSGFQGHGRRKGERRRKACRGCIVSPEIAVLNLMIVKQGDGPLPGLTDEEKPRMRGPKRASKVRKLFNLSKDDDVRKYVNTYRREFESATGKKKSKAPKIQRLVTPTPCSASAPSVPSRRLASPPSRLRRPSTASSSPSASRRRRSVAPNRSPSAARPPSPRRRPRKRRDEKGVRGWDSRARLGGASHERSIVNEERLRTTDAGPSMFAALAFTFSLPLSLFASTYLCHDNSTSRRERRSIERGGSHDPPICLFRAEFPDSIHTERRRVRPSPEA